MPPMSDAERALTTFVSLAQMVATIMEVGLQPCYKSTKQGFAHPAFARGFKFHFIGTKIWQDKKVDI